MKQFHIKARGKINSEELKQDIKIGLDSNVLVELINTPLYKGELHSVLNKFNIYKKGKLVTSEICVRETKRTLKNKYDFEDADKEVDDLVKSSNITVLKTNSKIIKRGKNLLKKHKPALHPPDNFILAAFLENNVSHILVIDYKFFKVAKRENIFAIKMPPKSSAIDKEFKRAFKH